MAVREDVRAFLRSASHLEGMRRTEAFMQPTFKRLDEMAVHATERRIAAEKVHTHRQDLLHDTPYDTHPDSERSRCGQLFRAAVFELAVCRAEESVANRTRNLVHHRVVVARYMAACDIRLHARRLVQLSQRATAGQMWWW